MADEEEEREEREAKSRQRRNVEILRSLRSAADNRLTDAINTYASRNMDDLREESSVRADVRGDLVSLQRRIDETLRDLSN